MFENVALGVIELNVLHKYRMIFKKTIKSKIKQMNLTAYPIGGISTNK